MAENKFDQYNPFLSKKSMTRPLNTSEKSNPPFFRYQIIKIYIYQTFMYVLWEYMTPSSV